MVKIDSAVRMFLSSLSREEVEYAFSILEGYRELPVSIRTFIEDPYFLGNSFRDIEFYPFWLRQFEIIYPHPILGSPFKECVFTGSIGTGKTTSAIIGTLYSIHRLVCMDNPQQTFRLSASTDIWFVLFTLTLDLVYDVLWNTMNEMMLISPYFNEINRGIDTKANLIQLPHRISVSAASRVQHTLGKAVFGGILDETNFGSSRVSGNQKVYDVYTSVLRRMESRFFKPPGQLFLVSSKRDESDFLEVHIKEARQKKIKTTYIVDTCLWEVKKDVFPYSGKTFKVFVGSQTQHPVFIDERNEDRYDKSRIIEVPVEHEEAFRKDIVNSLRDIAGISSISRYKFLSNVELVSKAMQVVNATEARYIEVSFQNNDQILDHLNKNVLLSYLSRNPVSPRVIHLDCATSKDAYGFAMGTISGLTHVEKPTIFNKNLDTPATHVVEPFVLIELVFGLIRGDQFEIPLFKMRKFILDLVELGFPIKIVTADSFQSKDTLQLLKLKGFDTRLVSVDKDKIPYLALKNAIYEERIHLPQHSVLQVELQELRETKDKIEHIESLSKDLADAVAAVTFTLLDQYRSGAFQQYYQDMLQQRPWVTGMDEEAESDQTMKLFEDKYGVTF